MSRFLHSGSLTSPHRLLLAHGAGAPMTSPFLEAFAAHSANCGIGVTRFEFDYMAERRNSGKKRPPPRIDALTIEFTKAIDDVRRELAAPQYLAIGGKSMGGRVASLIADEQWRAGSIIGLVCLGYPFHPPKKPDQLRTQHLETLACPTLIVQGTRDPFGSREWVAELTLSPAIEMHWIGDGDHDFGPRGASANTRKGNLADAAQAVAAFLNTLPAGARTPPNRPAQL